MLDTVFIRGLRAEGIIGVYGWERSTRQPLLIDLELGVDFSASAASDDLSDAVDYHALSQRVIAEIGATSFQLLEALGEHLLRVIFAEFAAVERIRLTLTKPEAVAEAAAVGVMLSRNRTQ